MSKKFFQDIDMSTNSLSNADSVSVNTDAVSANQLPRKSQVETISANAVQNQIVQSLGGTASDTVYSSSYVSTALDTKQPLMSIDGGSTSYLEIVDGYKIKMRDLGIITNHVNDTATTLNEFISEVTYLGDGIIRTSGNGDSFVDYDHSSASNQVDVKGLSSVNGTIQFKDPGDGSYTMSPDATSTLASGDIMRVSDGDGNDWRFTIGSINQWSKGVGFQNLMDITVNGSGSTPQGIADDFVDAVRNNSADDLQLVLPNSAGDDLDANTMIFLRNATNPAEKSFIYLGTDNENSFDFVKFSTDYNQSTIRTFFSANGTGVDYDSSTGIISLDLGNGVGELGAHTVPADGAAFTTVVGSNVEDLLLALESYIASVDSTATGGVGTVDARLTSLAGVNGNNMGTFTESLFPASSSLKTVLQDSETRHRSATDDRAAIRVEMAADKSNVEGQIQTEQTARIAQDNTLQSNINSEASSRQSADTSLQNQITTLSNQHDADDTNKENRLAALEADAYAPGSVLYAALEAESNAAQYTDGEVQFERDRALAAEQALDTKIDNLQEGDITFVGTIDGVGNLSIRQDRIDAGDTRNGASFASLAVSAGEVFVASANVTVTLTDTNLVLQKGDRVMALDDVGASAMATTDLNVTQADASALTVANLDSLRIEQTGGGKLDIVADSIGRTQLDSAIETDIDDKRSLTSTNSITSDGDVHSVTSNSVAEQQNVTFSRVQQSAATLTGSPATVRVNMEVNSAGSAFAPAPDFAYGLITELTYEGACADETMITSAALFKCGAKATAATQAVGVYAEAQDTQLGSNTGMICVADGGGSENVGAFCFSGSAASGKDRGVLGAVGVSGIPQYLVSRSSDPIPYDDIAVAADAKYAPAGTVALYTCGPVKLENGAVEVSDAPSTDNCVYRLADVKATEVIFETDLTDGVEKIIPCTLDLNKSLIQAVDNDELVSIDIVRDSANSQIKVTANGGNLTAARVIVKELECSVTSVA